MKTLHLPLGPRIMGATLAAAAASSKRVSKAAAEKVKAAASAVVAPVRHWAHNHPHVNPYYREGKYALPFQRSRWMPHNGAREMARRVRQRERAHAGA